MFYHNILPTFFEWPDLSSAGFPPSSFMDGYRWMQALANWLTDPVFDDKPNELRGDIRPRRITTAIAAGTAIPIGTSGMRGN